MYCVYRTTYFGNKMPSYYIGSSSEKRLKDGYKGSVKSKKWKKIWNDELKNFPELFSVEIISTHSNRQMALIEELRLQKLYDVVKNENWINESFASINGFFGHDVSGENNPMFGKGNKISEWCKNNPQKASERSRKSALTQWNNSKIAAAKIKGMIGKKRTRRTQTQEEFLIMQKNKLKKAKEKNLLKIEYDGKIYIGWKNLYEKTGVTKFLYNKYYLNGINPLLRKNKNGPIPKKCKPKSKERRVINE